MPRLAPRTDVLRALFARSGNRCAFPECTAALVNERNQFIAQVCHIEAAEQGGERFNALQTDEQRRAYENLLLLCYPHHVETNDEGLYPVERLQGLKVEHERAFAPKLFQIDESLLRKITSEMTEYWAHVESLHEEHRRVSDLAMEIDASANYLQLAELAVSLVADLKYIRDQLIELDRLRGRPQESQDPPSGPNYFETVYIGLTNTITKLSVALAHMELKYLEQHMKLTPLDLDARARLELKKAELARMASSAGYVD